MWTERLEPISSLEGSGCTGLARRGQDSRERTAGSRGAVLGWHLLWAKCMAHRVHGRAGASWWDPAQEGRMPLDWPHRDRSHSENVAPTSRNCTAEILTLEVQGWYWAGGPTYLPHVASGHLPQVKVWMPGLQTISHVNHCTPYPCSICRGLASPTPPPGPQGIWSRKGNRKTQKEEIDHTGPPWSPSPWLNLLWNKRSFKLDKI